APPTVVGAPSTAAPPMRRRAPVQAPSAAVPPTLLRPPVQATMNHPVAAPPPVVEPPAARGPPPPPPLAPGQDPEERRRRLIWRLFLLPDILRIVRAGLGAAMRAAEARF
ncbi:hypothetical protein C0995_002574, partial [Termitomyces sp. Mi166